MEQLDIHEARRRVHEREEIDERSLHSLLNGGASEREAALDAMVRTNLLRTVWLLAEKASLERYLVPDTIHLLDNLTPLADDYVPIIEVLKRLGIRQADAGEFEDAMRLLSRAMTFTSSIGLRYDSRSRRALRYLADSEIDGAFAKLAKMVSRDIVFPELGSSNRISIFVSALIDENSPTTFAIAIGKGLQDRGYDVSFVSSEWVHSEGSNALAGVRESGFKVDLARHDGTLRERVDQLLSFYREDPVAGTIFVHTPADGVAKVVSEVGTARAQFYLNTGWEQACGRFNYVFQTTSKAQETVTQWPGKSRYVGAFVAIADEIDQAVPLERTELGVPEDALLLATFGRLQKCSPDYLKGVSLILQREPRAVLILAGPTYHDEMMKITAEFERAGVADRVRVLGPRQKDEGRLLKTIDLYLDPFPWPGGLALLDAMYAGVAVVAMRRHRLPELDPTNEGPISSTVEAFMPKSIRLAASGDLEDYADIALYYLRDESLRRRDGAILRSHTLENFTTQCFSRMDGFIRGAIAVPSTIYD